MNTIIHILCCVIFPYLVCSVWSVWCITGAEHGSFALISRLLQIIADIPSKQNGWEQRADTHPLQDTWYFLGPGFRGMLMIAAKLLPAASPRHNYLINQRIHSLLHNQHTLGHSITTPSQDDTINDWAEMVSISRTFIDYHQIPRDSRKSGEWKILLRSDVIKVENILAVYTVKLA